MIKVVIFILPVIICTVGFFLWGSFGTRHFNLKTGAITAILGFSIGILLGAACLITSYEYLSELRQEANKTVITSEVVYPLYKNANGYLLYDVSTQRYIYTYCKDMETVLEDIDPDRVSINYLLDETEEPYLKITTEKPVSKFAAAFYKDLDCYFYNFYIPANSIIVITD